jgi:hypothetical protein
MADFLDNTIGNAFFLPVGSITNFALNGTTDALEFIFQATEAATITTVGFRYGARTGTPPTYRISLQGVAGATGYPDGTIKGGGSPASATFTPPASTAWDGLWQWITLSNSYTCTRGELLALVIDYSSGTCDVSNNSSFTRTIVSPATSMPHAIQNDAAVRTKTTVGTPIFGYASSSKSFGKILSTSLSTNFTNASTPDEYALRFIVPSTWCSTYTIGRVECHAVVVGGARTAKLQLYDGTTVLQTYTLDGDISGSAGFNVFVPTETTLATLTAGNVYRIGLQPQEASNWSWPSFTVLNNQDLGCHPGGIEWYQSTRTDVGAWSDTTITRPLMAIGIDDWTAPAGGGTVIAGTPMLRGMV